MAKHLIGIDALGHEVTVDCLSCRDTGRNARTNLECLDCPRGLELLQAGLVGVQPESLTDRLTAAWRTVVAVGGAMSEDRLDRELWEAECALRRAIDVVADLETVIWLRRGKDERQRRRMEALADQATITIQR